MMIFCVSPLIALPLARKTLDAPNHRGHLTALTKGILAYPCSMASYKRARYF